MTRDIRDPSDQWRDWTDESLDKQYRLGYEQAWREWSAVISETAQMPVRQKNIERMNVRLIEVQNR